MENFKAQAATEMIIILALALIILLHIFIFNTDMVGSVNKKLRAEKARTFLNDIGDAAELVYQQGAGSKTKLYISLPNSINTSTVSGKTISIVFKGTNDTIYRNLDFDVNGTLPKDEGFYWIYLKSKEGHVWINSSTS